MQSRRTSGLEIAIQVALLTPEGGANGQESLHEATAALAVAAEAALSPEYGEAQGALGGIVGRLDALVVDKGE